MPKAFTSGLNTADKKAEKKINGTGIAIFLGAFFVLLIMFFIFFGGSALMNNTDKNAAPTENNRSQP